MAMQSLFGLRNRHGANLRRLSIFTTAVLFVAALEVSDGLGLAQAFAVGGGGGGTNHPPVISNFTASHSVGNYWTFSGQVTDDQSVAGLIVTLGGLPSLAGVTATVNSQGWFSVTVQLGPNESGTATAQTTDAGGLASNVAWTIVN
jgi:hypothetical protein